MCGIMGYVGEREAVPILLGGLRTLEYRGYDSAGIAVLQNGSLVRHRSIGKLQELEKLVYQYTIKSVTGIGHTRWATHGRPTEDNAHPHTDCEGNLAIVHNGIIENSQDLRASLGSAHRFATQTDSEVLAHLIERELAAKSGKRDAQELTDAVRRACLRVEGTYAIAVVSRLHQGVIVGARKGSPLILGIGRGEGFLSSDIPGVLAHTREVIPLDDGEFVTLTKEGHRITDHRGKDKRKTSMHVQWDPVTMEKGGYKHFMLKEIHEQPRAIEDTLRGRILGHEVALDSLGVPDAFWSTCDRIIVTACGTAWHAGLIGKYYLEEFARIPVEVDIASEFGYRRPVYTPHTLLVAISQSGETMDTLAAVKEAKRHGVKVLSVCNVIGSTLTREADGSLYTFAGPEMGVASTKAFTSQVTAMLLLALFIGQHRGTLSKKLQREMMTNVITLPRLVEGLLSFEESIAGLAKKYFQARDMLYLGRGVNFPIALEGALKLKEISYIHAEGYASGEMKHGPIALIDEHVPVVVIAPSTCATYDKIRSNVEQVRARDGKVIAVLTEGDRDMKKLADDVIWIPKVHEWLTPVCAVIPLQLFAYHIGVRRGCDVDQPRNLSKSVTVE